MNSNTFSRILLFVGLLGLIGLLGFSQVETTQAATSQSSHQHTAVIATGALNVRSGPGIAFTRTAVVYQGTTVALLGRNVNATWVKIQMADGHQGWVNVAYTFPSTAVINLPVVDAPTQPLATAVVNTGTLNVRAGPSVAFSVVTVSEQGHVVHLLGRNADSSWAKVRVFTGQEGWVNASLITPNVPISSLPIVSAPSIPEVTPTAVVNTGALNVRSGPGVAFSVVTVSRQGHAVHLLGRNADSSWARVRVFTGQEGWVNASLITPNVPISSLPVVAAPSPPGVTPTAVVTTGALNVRSGPGVGYSVVAWVQQGQTLTLLGRNANNSWVQVRTPASQTGWVNASLVRANVAISSLPVVGTAPPAATAVVATGALNVRYGPGVAYGAFTVVYQGTTVTLLGRNQSATWVKIQLPNGNQGWVNATLVQASVPIVNLPIVG